MKKQYSEKGLVGFKSYDDKRGAPIYLLAYRNTFTANLFDVCIT